MNKNMSIALTLGLGLVIGAVTTFVLVKRDVLPTTTAAWPTRRTA